MGKQIKHYNAEFKQDAVNYYYSSGKTGDQVAKENEGIVQHRGSGNYSSDIEKENARLKKELRDSQDALSILKKAISILNDELKIFIKV